MKELTSQQFRDRKAGQTIRLPAPTRRGVVVPVGGPIFFTLRLPAFAGT